MELEPNIAQMDATGKTYCGMCSEAVYADSDWHTVPTTTVSGAHTILCHSCYLDYTAIKAEI
jgi:uncharacterized protein YuzB (UPF0349 family)